MQFDLLVFTKKYNDKGVEDYSKIRIITQKINWNVEPVGRRNGPKGDGHHAAGHGVPERADPLTPGTVNRRRTRAARGGAALQPPREPSQS